MCKNDRHSAPLKARHLAAPLAFAFLGATLLMSGGPLAAQAPSEPQDRTGDKPSIFVSGEGEVQTKPDTAAINVGVVTEAETAKQALAANSQAMQQLFNVLDQQGIAGEDRQTVRFDVSPQYRQDPEPRGSFSSQAPDSPREPRIVGYQVTNEVRITVRKITEVGTILDAVVEAGSNRIHGIEFSVEDQEQLMDVARQRAVRRAKEKAELLAEAAGVSLGNVIAIQEETQAQPVPQRGMMMMMESRSAPIAPGEQTLTARVFMTYELETDKN